MQSNDDSTQCFELGELFEGLMALSSLINHHQLPPGQVSKNVSLWALRQKDISLQKQVFSLYIVTISAQTTAEQSGITGFTACHSDADNLAPVSTDLSIC